MHERSKIYVPDSQLQWPRDWKENRKITLDNDLKTKGEINCQGTKYLVVKCFPVVIVVGNQEKKGENKLPKNQIFGRNKSLQFC